MSGSASRFGPYELHHRLGAGGMAETFLAVRRGPGGFEQRVCVKRILPAFEQDAAFVHQFLQEARVSANLRHANIVQVLDFGVVEGSHYLALELVDGMDLYRLLRALEERGDRMTSGLVVQLAMELATALDYAHHVGSHGGGAEGPVVHRDISPSNVLVSRAGEVKLTDFGIAKAISTSGPLTTTGVIKGKVPYMAPEYALAGRFDPRCDLFALGVLLFEALAGRRPFIGATDLDTLQRILEGRRPSLTELCPGAPEALASAIERLIAPKPEERFQSAAELLDALVDVAPPPTARRILGDLVRRMEAGSLPPASLPPEPRESTAVLSDAAPRRSDPIPASAGPHDPTRTRPPLSHEALATVRTPVPQHEWSQGSSSAAHTATVVGPKLAAELTDPLRSAGSASELPRTGGVGSTTPRSVEFSRPRPSSSAPARRRSLAPLIGGAVAVLAVIGIGSGIAIVRSMGPSTEITTPPGPEIGGAAPEPAIVSAGAPVTVPAIATTPTITAPDPGVSGVLARGGPDGRDHRSRTGETTEGEPIDPVELAPEPVATPEPTRRHHARDRRPEPRDAPAATTPVATTPTPTTPTPTPPVAEPARSEPGTLRVVVLPFGEVWIDGDHVGSSPITRSVSAGSHVIEAGTTRDARTMRRSVEIRSGEQESVVLR